jgi:hypothetical protein
MAAWGGAEGFRTLKFQGQLQNHPVIIFFFLNERHEIVHVSINKEESEAVPKRHRRKGT